MKTKEKIRQIIGLIILITGFLGLFLPIIPGILLILISFNFLENNKNINKISKYIDKIILKNNRSIDIIKYKKA